MSEELYDVARAFAALQVATARLESPTVQAATSVAIDALLMAIGAFDLRLGLLERGAVTDLRHDDHIAL